MRTIILTEEEHYKLLTVLRNMLNQDTYLGSRFIYESSTKLERFELMKVKHKLEEVNRDA